MIYPYLKHHAKNTVDKFENKLLYEIIIIMIVTLIFIFQASGSNHVYLYLLDSKMKVNEHYNIFVLYTEKSKITGYPIIGHMDIQDYELKKIDYDFHDNNGAFLLEPGFSDVGLPGLNDFVLTPKKKGSYILSLKITANDPMSHKSKSVKVRTNSTIKIE